MFRNAGSGETEGVELYITTENLTDTVHIRKGGKILHKRGKSLYRKCYRSKEHNMNRAIMKIGTDLTQAPESVPILVVLSFCLFMNDAKGYQCIIR